MSNIYNAIQNVYNMNKTTWQEVLAELYNLVSNVENKFDLFENKFGQLLGEEVTIELKKMYNNGSLATLINDKLLKDINTKIVGLKTEVIEQLDTKAKQIDLDIERKRIDNIVKNEGTSVNDIELQDIRIPVNGKNYDSAGAAIRGQIGELYDNLNNTITRINELEYYNISCSFLENGYINYNNGFISSHENYKCSDYINVSKYKGKEINVTTYFDYGAGIAQYQKDKTFISGIGQGDYKIGEIQKFKIVGDYIRVTSITSHINKFKMFIKLNDLLKETEKETEEETINPCKYNGRSMTMFNRGICIGDSFTEGASNINNSNEQFISDRFNYPKILSKLSNVEIINKGHSGITTKAWYDKYKNTDLSGYDFAIIYLGINDYFSNNKTLFSTEYKQIIDKLRNDNKHIKIFCVTQTKHFRDFANFTHYVREIATEKECYLIDLEKYSTFYTGHMTGGHPNAYGYFTMANDIYSYINYIIDNNIADFKNHQFTNTNYSF